MPFPAYAQSKLAMLMFAIELDRRSRANGWHLTSVAAHPGLARTDMLANGAAMSPRQLLWWIGWAWLAVLGQTAAAGVLPTLMAATMPGITGGAYLGPQGWKELKGVPGKAKIEPRALDAAVAAKLWAASEALTGVRFGDGS